MEAEGALKIWKRSEELYKLRYTVMISDDNSSTYPKIAAANPYGHDHPVVKQECVGHVQKQMFNHLTAAKKLQHRGPDSANGREGSPH